MKLKLTLLLISLVFSVDSAMAQKVIGRMAVAKGKVQVISESGKSSKARFGTKINQGDTVVTEKNARAKIVMLDKNVVHVSPETKMSFDSYEIEAKAKKTNIIGVAYGKIRNDVKQKYDGKNQKFQVRTKAAVAGVRGTDWVTEYSKETKEANFLTFEGQIEVGILGPDGALTNSVMVGAGQQLGLFEGQIPGQPIQVPQSKLNDENKGSKVDDSGEPKTGPEGSKGEGPGKKPGKKVNKKSASSGEGGSGGESLIGDLIEEEGGGLPEGSEDIAGWEEASLGELPEPEVNPLVKVQCESCEETVTQGTTNLLIDVNLSESN